MKWFKHDSAASMDAKLKKLRLKYGMEGYGVYWYCLELIAQNVEKHNLTFELEHDAEIIAADTNIHPDRISEMMAYMINLGLFESNQSGMITCIKMATRTDEYTQTLMRSQANIPRLSRETTETIPINSQLIEQKRREQKRREEAIGATSRPTKRFIPPNVGDVTAYAKERGYRGFNSERFIAFYESKGWMVGKNKMKCWKAAARGWATRDGNTNKSEHLLGAI